MRKPAKLSLLTVLIFSIAAAFPGCANTDAKTRTFTDQTGARDIIEKAASEATALTASENTSASTPPASSAPATPSNIATIDLTTMSANMVYSQVFCMVMEPDEYLGATVKMNGAFVHFYDEENDKHYFACIIKDAMQCCAQGIEFDPGDKYVYPDDFPEDGGEICVEGVFDKYNEGGNNYLTLRDAVILEAGASEA